jgi:hypothetical protein
MERRLGLGESAKALHEVGLELSSATCSSRLAVVVETMDVEGHGCGLPTDVCRDDEAREIRESLLG